ncbi:MAG: hypothetical protein AAGA54_34340 [Myxococcota bacterium]
MGRFMWLCTVLSMSIAGGCGRCEPWECEEYCADEHPGGEVELEACRVECMEACRAADPDIAEASGA